jgi:hypothetical protein
MTLSACVWASSVYSATRLKRSVAPRAHYESPIVISVGRIVSANTDGNGVGEHGCPGTTFIAELDNRLTGIDNGQPVQQRSIPVLAAGHLGTVYIHRIGAAAMGVRPDICRI